MQCPICDSRNASTFFSLPRIPIANNVLCRTYEEAIHFPVGSLNFIFCEDCHHGWNADFDASLLSYDNLYENNQSFSEVFLQHVDNVIEKIPSYLMPLQLLEVGCGQGYFLERVVHNLTSNLKYAVGFDPALKVSKTTGRYSLVQGVLDTALFPQDFVPNLIILRHVVEHIVDNEIFFASIFPHIPDVEVCIVETPDIAWIINNNAYFDMYYEHCSLFSKQSIQILLEKFNYSHCATENMFGGQYMLSVASHTTNTQTYKRESLAGVRDFSSFFEIYLEKWGNYISLCQKEKTNIAVWGAASKGVIFLQHMKKIGVTVDYVIDININKQGCYIPCVGTQIIKPEDIKQYNIQTIIVANPLYINEVKHICNQLDINLNIIPLE